MNGLDKQPLPFIAEKIASLGFNCIRLVNSLDVIYKNPIVDVERLSANPDLVGKSALEIHDEVVRALTEANLKRAPKKTLNWCNLYMMCVQTSVLKLTPGYTVAMSVSVKKNTKEQCLRHFKSM